MTPKDSNDPGGIRLSWVVYLLVLTVVYLAVTLPFSPNSGAIGGAIVALAALIGAILERRGRRNNGKR